MPMVICFHGANDSGSHFKKFAGFDEVADDLGFIMVYPDAADGNWDGDLNSGIFSVLAQRDVLTEVRVNNSCLGDSTVIVLPNSVHDGKKVRKESYRNKTDEKKVVFYIIKIRIPIKNQADYFVFFEYIITIVQMNILSKKQETVK